MKLDPIKEKAKIIEVIKNNFFYFGFFSRLKFLNDYKKPENPINTGENQENPGLANQAKNSAAVDKTLKEVIKEKMEKSKIIKFLKEFDLTLEANIKESRITIIKNTYNEINLTKNLKNIFDNIQFNSSNLNISNEQNLLSLCDKNKQNFNLRKFQELYLNELKKVLLDSNFNKDQLKEINNLAYLNAINSCVLNKYNIEKYQATNNIYYEKLIIHSKNFFISLKSNPKKTEFLVSCEDYKIYLSNETKHNKNNSDINKLASSKGNLIFSDFNLDIKSTPENEFENINKIQGINNNDQNQFVQTKSFEIKFELLLETFFDSKFNLKKEILDLLEVKSEQEKKEKIKSCDLGSFKIFIGKKQYIFYNELFVFLNEFFSNISIYTLINKNHIAYNKNISSIFSKKNKFEENISFLKNNAKDISYDNLINYYSLIENFFKSKKEEINKIIPKSLLENIPLIKLEVEAECESIDIIYPFYLPFKNYRGENSNKFLLFSFTGVRTHLLLSSNGFEGTKTVKSIHCSLFDDFISSNKNIFIVNNKIEESSDNYDSINKIIFKQENQAFKMELLKILNLQWNHNISFSNFSTENNQINESNKIADIKMNIQDFQIQVNKYLLVTINKLSCVKSHFYTIAPFSKELYYKNNFEENLKKSNYKLKNMQLCIPSEYFESFKKKSNFLTGLSEVFPIEPNKFYESVYFLGENIEYIYLIDLNLIVPIDLIKGENENLIFKDLQIRDDYNKTAEIIEIYCKNKNIKFQLKNSDLIKRDFNHNEYINNCIKLNSIDNKAVQGFFSTNVKFAIENNITKDESINKGNNQLKVIDIIEYKNTQSDLVNKFFEYFQILVKKISRKNISFKCNIQFTDINILNVNEMNLLTEFIYNENNIQNLKFDFKTVLRLNIENICSGFTLNISDNNEVKDDKNHFVKYSKLNTALKYEFSINNIYSYYKNNQNLFFEFKPAEQSINSNFNLINIDNLSKEAALKINISISKNFDINLSHIKDSFNSNINIKQHNNDQNINKGAAYEKENLFNINKIAQYLFDFSNLEKSLEFSIQKDFILYYDSEGIFDIVRFFLEVNLNMKKNELITLNKFTNIYDKATLQDLNQIHQKKIISINDTNIDKDLFSDIAFLYNIKEIKKHRMELYAEKANENINKPENQNSILSSKIGKDIIFKILDNTKINIAFNKIDIYLINNKLDTYFCKMSTDKLYVKFMLKLKLINNFKSESLLSKIEKMEMETGFENLTICDTTNYPFYSDSGNSHEMKINQENSKENKELELLSFNNAVKLNFSFLFVDSNKKYIQENGVESIIHQDIISVVSFKYPNLKINYIYQPFKRFQRYLDYELKKFIKIGKIYKKNKNMILNNMKYSEYSKFFEFMKKAFAHNNHKTNKSNSNQTEKQTFNNNFTLDLDLNFLIDNCIVFIDDRCKNGDKLKYTFVNINCNKKFFHNFIFENQQNNKKHYFNKLDKNSLDRSKVENDNFKQNDNNENKLNHLNTEKKGNSKIILEEIKMKIKKFDIKILTQTLLSTTQKTISNISEVEIITFIPLEALKKDLIEMNEIKNKLDPLSNTNSKKRKSTIKNLNETFFSKNSKIIDEDLDLNTNTIYTEILLNEGLKINLMKEDLNSMYNIFTNNIMFKDQREHLFKFTMNELELKPEPESNVNHKAINPNNLNPNNNVYNNDNNTLHNTSINLNLNTSINESISCLKNDEDGYDTDLNYEREMNFKFKNNNFLYLYAFELKWYIPFISFNLINDAKFYEYFPTEEFIDFSSELKLTNFYFLFLKKKEKNLSRVQNIKISFDEIELIFLNEKLFTNYQLVNKSNPQNNVNNSPFNIDIEYIINNSTFTYEDDLKNQADKIENLNIDKGNKKCFNFKEESTVCRMKLENLNFFLKYDLIILLKALLESMFYKNSFSKLKKKQKKFITEIDLRPCQNLFELNIKNTNFIFLSENLKNRTLSKNGINDIINLNQNVINLNVDSTSLIFKYSKFFETKHMNKIYSYISKFQDIKKQKVKFLNLNHKNEVYVSTNKIKSFQHLICNNNKHYYFNDNDLFKENKNLQTNIKYYNYIDIENDLISYLKTNFDVMCYLENIELQIIKLAEKYFTNNSFSDIDENVNSRKTQNSKRLVVSKEKGNFLNFNMRKNYILGKKTDINDISNVDHKSNIKNENKNILEFDFDVGNFEFKLSYRDIISIIDIVNYNLKFKENEEFMKILEYIKESSYTDDMDEFYNSKDKSKF